MYRTFVIVRHSFLEAIVQPIYSLLLVLGVAILVIFGALPFFTLGEDTVMFKDVGLDVILLLVLIATLFATSRSIYDEIEDRTMLTLMSKPVRKWEVLVGKYIGLIAAAGMAIAILGGVLCLTTWWRIPRDYQFATMSLDDRELARVLDTRLMHIAGLLPSFALIWMQISVLAAISVAISTRVSLVVNLPVVILLYLGGNLTRFLFPLPKDFGGAMATIAKPFAYVLATVVPYLEIFDLKQKAVYGHITLSGSSLAPVANAISPGELWGYTGVAGLYALCFAIFALSLGMLMFQSRELGGGES